MMKALVYHGPDWHRASTSAPPAQGAAMTRSEAQARIIVAVNDTDGARAALSWAAIEAVTRNASLMLAHVPDPIDATVHSGGDPGLKVLNHLGSMQLAQLAYRMYLQWPRLQIETVLGRGDVAAALIELSGQADLLVVGTTGSGGNLTSLLGSVSQRVAVHSHCPVVVVGHVPSASSSGDRESGVVVGLSSTPAGLAAIRLAFTEADRRGVRLTAIRTGATALNAADAVELAAGRARFPRVPLIIRSTLEEPAVALEREAEHADLLVLGAHHSDDHWSTRLGPVPQSLLHHTDCPIVLVGSAESVPALSPA